MLVIGGSLTASARAMGHYLSLGMTVVMMLGLSIYVYEHRRKLPDTMGKWKKWVPFVLMVIASILVNLDPLRHVLQDLEIWESPGSSEYRQKCHIEKFRCLSPLGWWMTVVMTYTGFTLLLVAAFWNANIMDKCSAIKTQWNALRGKK